MERIERNLGEWPGKPQRAHLYSPRRRILGQDMVKGIVDQKPFSFSSGEEGVVTADKSEAKAVAGQGLVVTQGYSQLHGVVGFEGMVLSQMRRHLEIGCNNRNSIQHPNSDVFHTGFERPVSRPPAYPLRALEYGKRRCAFGDTGL